MYVFLLILLPLAGGLAAGICGRRSPKSDVPIALSALALEWLLCLWLIPERTLTLDLPGWVGLGLHFQVTGLSVLLCVAASTLWLVSGIADREYLHHDPKTARYHVFLLLTEGAIVGVFLSGDFYTTLVFFEMMSLASYLLVLHNETTEAREAAASYLAYAVIGGMVTLMGLFLLWNALGTLTFDQLPEAVAAYEGDRRALYAGGICTLVGFAAKCCMWPLHTWLPKAHPAAPAPASALLSGIITKGGVFGILALAAKVFAQDANAGNCLLCFGVITMLWGGFMGLCHTNVKAVLACSTMSQIGFILTGTAMSVLLGEEKGIAVWGTLLHMMNHSWFKLVLFVSVGIIAHTTGKLELSDLQGFGRGKGQLLVIFLLPALGIMGLPGFNGYISKTLIHESIVEYIHLLSHTGGNVLPYKAAEWLFLLSGGMTVGYMLKLILCLFVERNADEEVQKAYDATKPAASPLLMGLLTFCAALCPLLGLTPHQTLETVAKYAQDFFDTEGVEETLHYFSLTNLKGGAISIAIGLLLYFGFVRTLVRRKQEGRVCYRNPWPAVLSLEDSFYRPLIAVWLPFFGTVCARFLASLFSWLTALANRILFFRFDPIVRPPEAPRFAHYDPHPQGRRGSFGTLNFGLVLFALGYMAIMIYLLVRNVL